LSCHCILQARVTLQLHRYTQKNLKNATTSSNPAQSKDDNQPQTTDSLTSAQTRDGNLGPPPQDYLKRQDIPKIVQQLLMPFGVSSKRPSGPNPVICTGHTNSLPPLTIASTPHVTVEIRSGASVTVQATSHGALYLPGIFACSISSVAKVIMILRHDNAKYELS